MFVDGGSAVDLNLVDSEPGSTALVFAVEHDCIAIVAALLAATGKDGVAADLNVADKDGHTALIKAAFNGHVEIVAALLAAPGKDGVAVDLNLANKDGMTALMLAAFNGHVEVVAALLAATGIETEAVVPPPVVSTASNPLICKRTRWSRQRRHHHHQLCKRLVRQTMFLLVT